MSPIDGSKICENTGGTAEESGSGFIAVFTHIPAFNNADGETYKEAGDSDLGLL